MKLLITLISLAGCGPTMEHCVRSPAGEQCFETRAEQYRELHRQQGELAARIAAESKARNAEVERQAWAERAAEERRASELEVSADQSRAVALAEYRVRTAREAAERQALAERVSLAAARASDPVYAVPALSAMICEREALIASLGTEARREARLSAAAGATRPKVRFEIAEAADDAKVEVGKLKAALARLGGTRVACSAPLAPDAADVVQVLRREVLGR